VITWAIGTMGGTVASGIPSEETGLAILRDLVKDWNDRAAEDGPGDPDVDEIKRDFLGAGDGDREFWGVVCHGRQHACLHPEDRCDHCGQVRDYFHGYHGI